MMPKVPGTEGSIWYEVALDGILLYEQDRCVTSILQHIRRAIADGCGGERHMVIRTG